MPYDPITPFPVPQEIILGVYGLQDQRYVLARLDGKLVSYKRFWNKALVEGQDIRWKRTSPAEHREVLAFAAKCKLGLREVFKIWPK